MKRLMLAAFAAVALAACGNHVSLEPTSTEGKCLQTREKTSLGITISKSDYIVNC